MNIKFEPDVNLSIIFTELELLERFEAVSQVGFGAVELWWPFDFASPSDKSINELTRAITDQGLKLVGMNFDAGNMAQGDRGLVSIPGQQDRFKTSVDAAIEFAKGLGCKAFNALYGNRIEGVDPKQQDELAIENLLYATNAVKQIQGVVLIETQNNFDSPSYPLLKAQDAISVIDKVRSNGYGNIAFLADLYHLHRMGEDLVSTIEKYSSYIEHIQVADDPGRHQPGTGTIDFDAAFDALEANGYKKYMGLEYKPQGQSKDSFDWIPLDKRKSTS